MYEEAANFYNHIIQENDKTNKFCFEEEAEVIISAIECVNLCKNYL
jgi:hypothetical protein